MEDLPISNQKIFFKWLSNTVPLHEYQIFMSEYKIINSALENKRLLLRPLTEITHVWQVENALRQVKRVFTTERRQINAMNLLRAYIKFLNRDNVREENLIEDDDKIKSEEKSADDGRIKFDGTNFKDFKDTKPIDCKINGTAIEEKSWSSLFAKVVEYEIANRNPEIKSLRNKNLSPRKKGRPFFMAEAIAGLHCKRVSNGYWINVNFSAPDTVKEIDKFCKYCGHTQSEIELYGVKKIGDTADD
ncbi:MAG: hypothetical protein K6G55_07625 [Selenomonadaceae bacterium]|nr:hypothetical protein [Selenomonadaceae bacterium]